MTTAVFDQKEINFVPNRSFTSKNSEQIILTDVEPGSEVVEAEQPQSLPPDLPPHLARLCEAELLTAEQERNLFQRMNYLKYRANVLRGKLDPQAPDMSMLEAAERHLAEAQSLRDQIVQANMRLVLSIVKKFVTPQHSFDDLLSEGIMTLMNAVEKFDYDRGFRFSTYAYRSISRAAYRAILDRRKELSRQASVAEDTLDAAEDEGGSSMDERVWELLRSRLKEMLGRLDRREQFVIRGRYALGAHRKVRTFQCLADKLGVSKERARQLEQRAVAKLREMAKEFDADALAPALV